MEAELLRSSGFTDFIRSCCRRRKALHRWSLVCCLPLYLSLNCRKSTLCSQTNAVLNATAHLPAQLTSCLPYRKWWLSNSGRKCSVLVFRKVAALIESGEILGGKRKCLCHIQIFRVLQKTCSGQKQVATSVASEQARGVIFYFYFCWRILIFLKNVPLGIWESLGN